jgi:KaiC/GvpD/RAD55 family RecA-like ATPase
MQHCGHFVDFYDTDDEFVTTAATFLNEGFVAGSSCIAVLTAEHQMLVRRRLLELGSDSQQLSDDYRFVCLDANEMLESLWIEGRFDACGFHGKFADLIRLLSAGGRQVRIIGEMVDLLAERGRYDTVIQIEELCNELSREYAFQMCCLYRQHVFVQPLDESARRRVCAVHSGV